MSRPPSLPRRRLGPVKIVLLVLGGLLLVIIASVVIWRVRLQHKVDAQLAAIKAAGLPTSGAELNEWYPQVPDHENGARVMAQAFQLWQALPDKRYNRVASFKLPPRGEALSAEDRKFLEDYVALNRAALAKAHEVTAFTNSRYPIDYSLGVNTLLPHLAQVKRLAQLASFDAFLASEAGRTADATRSIETILGCARTLEPEPDLISQLVRIAALAIGVDGLEREMGAGKIDAEDLARLAADFSAAEKTNQITRALIAERAMNTPLFRMSMTEMRRLGDQGDAETQPPAGPPLPGRRPGILRATGFFERGLSFYLAAMQTNMNFASQSPPQSLFATKAGEAQAEVARKNYYILSAMLLPALPQCVVKETGGFARVRLAQTALAIERFRLAERRLPKDLDELVPRFLPAVPIDPFDGAPLRYRLLPKGYLIYSVDRDGHDDGGRERPANAKSTDRGAYDLSFLVER